MYSISMTSVSLSEFRNNQSDFIAVAQREPVEITSRGTTRRAVLVSPEFYDRALAALEELEDIQAAARARRDPGESISHDDLIAELGL